MKRQPRMHQFSVGGSLGRRTLCEEAGRQTLQQSRRRRRTELPTGWSMKPPLLAEAEPEIQI